MRCRFMVKVTDVFYFPIKGAKVEVFTSPTFDVPSFGNPKKVIPAQDAGIHLTDDLDVAMFEVEVSHPDFFSAHQTGRVQPGEGSALPKVVFGDKNQLFEQELPSYSLVIHTHDGAVPVVELYIALGRLMDTTADAIVRAEIFSRKPSLGKGGGFITPVNHEIRIFSTNSLLAADASKGSFEFQKKILAITGKSHFALWKPKPDTGNDQRPGRNMVAIYDPSTKFSNRNPRSGLAQEQPINYHVFLHPSTSWFPDPDYPMGSWWLDLVGRYIYGRQPVAVKLVVASTHINGAVLSSAFAPPSAMV